MGAANAGVNCDQVKYCGRGPQLFLRDPYLGDHDKDHPKDPDRGKWIRRHVHAVPVSADDVISAADPSGTSLQVLDPEHGAPTGTINLTPATAAFGPITAVATNGAEIVWLSGEMYALGADPTKALWQTDSPSPPVVVSTTGEQTPDLPTARITIPTNAGVAIVDGNDGNLGSRFQLRVPGPGSLVYSLGTGFLIAGPAGMIAYR